MKKYIILGVILLFGGFVSWRLLHSRKATLSPAENETLIVGTNDEYPPFSFSEDNQIVGFDIDLIKEVAHRLGKKIEIRNMSFTSLIPQLQLGTIQVIAAGMSPTEERAQQALFTRPHLNNSALVVLMPTQQLPADNKNIIEFLKQKRVLVNEGFSADLYVTQQGIPNRKLTSVSDALMALRSGQADAFVSGALPLQNFFEQYGRNEFSTLELPNTTEPVALVVSQAHPQLLTQIQQVLTQMEEDGSLHNLKRRWKLEQ